MFGAGGLGMASGWHHTGLIFLTVPAMVLWQMQEFLRQVLYVENRLRAAFLNDVISYGGQLVAFLVAHFAGVLTPGAALLIIAATSAAAGLIGLVAIRRSLAWPGCVGQVRDANAESWNFGRWTLGSAVIFLGSYYVYPFLLAAFAGAPAAASIRVMVTLMGPVRIILTGIFTTFTPVAARIAEDADLPALRLLVRRMFLVSGLPILAYCVISSVFARPLVSSLFGPNFAGDSWLLPLVALSYVLNLSYTPIEIALRALRKPEVLFRASMAIFAAFWLFGLPAIYFFGLTGAAATLVGTPAVMSVALWRRYRTDVREPAAASMTKDGPRPGIEGLATAGKASV
jgi:O-antigen/teichoic acid export membrane protein